MREKILQCVLLLVCSISYKVNLNDNLALYLNAQSLTIQNLNQTGSRNSKTLRAKFPYPKLSRSKAIIHGMFMCTALLNVLSYSF